MKKLLLIIILFTITLSAQAQVTTLYGDGDPGYSASNSNADTTCRFNAPYGCAYDSKGNLWLTDQGDNYIVMISGGKYQLREGYPQGGFNDGTSVGSAGGITNYPAGIVVVPGKTSANDQIYVCDGGNNAIRKIDSFVNITQGQKMSTVAGGGTKMNGFPGASGYVNGSGATALFDGPAGLGYVKDASGGYLVVADLNNNAVRKVSLHKSDYGTTSDIATVNNPNGIFVDASNNIYVASTSEGIVEIPFNSVTPMTIVKGMFFELPRSVVVKGNDMYIGDNCHIAYFDMTKPASFSNPSVYAGDPADTICSYANGADTVALFNGINSMTLSPDGLSLIVADALNNRFRKVTIPVSNGFKLSQAAKSTFNIYPNPANGYIYINDRISGSADVALFTVTGKQVLNEKDVMFNAGQPYSLDVENQHTGVYVLQITTGKGVYNNKIVIR